MVRKNHEFDTMEGRLAYVIDSFGVNELAEAIGISVSQIYRISGGAKTTLENAIKIAQVTGFNLQWLAFGEGPQQTIESAGLDESIYAMIPDIKDTNIVTPFNKAYLSNELNSDPANCLTWKVVGNHLNNKYINGDILLIDTNQKAGNGNFLIKVANSEVIVSIQNMLNGTVKTVRTVSGKETEEELAPNYFDNLNIIGRVIWSSRKDS